MEALKVYQEKGSLLDLLDEWDLPVLVTVSVPYKFEDELDLHVGNELCVLERKKVKVLNGADYDKVLFHINIEEQSELFVDVVNEKHALNADELRRSLPHISYLLSKAEFQYKSINFNKWEKFKVKEYSTESICLVSSSNDKVFLTLEHILSNNSFLFVEYKETIELQHFLKENLNSQTVCFRQAAKKFPSGLVTLQGVRSCDAILTVADAANHQHEKVYKMFELDKQIKCSISSTRLPTHVLALGKYNSNAYRDCIKEIEFSMDFSIYSSVFYGSLVIENLSNSVLVCDTATASSLKLFNNDINLNYLLNSSTSTTVREGESIGQKNTDEHFYANIQDLTISVGNPECKEEKKDLFENPEDNAHALKKKYWFYESFFRNKKNESGNREGALPNITNRLQKTGFPAISGQCLHPKGSIKDGENKIENNNVKIKKTVSLGFKNSQVTKKSNKSPFNENGLSLYKKKQISHSESSLIGLSSNNKQTRSSFTMRDLSPTTAFQKQEVQSIQELESCSIEEIIKLLHNLKLEKYEDAIKAKLNSDNPLTNFSEETFRKMNFTSFEARKLYKYIHGWRVNKTNCTGDLKDNLVINWSVDDTINAMNASRLLGLAKFAAENQVDGAMLEDIMKNNIIQTLEEDHGVHLGSLELEKLNYLVTRKNKQ